jgi:hypothetical protein
MVCDHVDTHMRHRFSSRINSLWLSSVRRAIAVTSRNQCTIRLTQMCHTATINGSIVIVISSSHIN